MTERNLGRVIKAEELSSEWIGTDVRVIHEGGRFVATGRLSSFRHEAGIEEQDWAGGTLLSNAIVEINLGWAILVVGTRAEIQPM